MSRFSSLLLTLLAFVIATTSITAFTQPSTLLKTSASVSSVNNKNVAFPNPNTAISSPMETKTVLMERRWNFNEAREPWGMKKNAEIWNGRVAQMGFTVVLLQELVTGKGVVAGLSDGDFISYALLGATGLTVIGLTVFLAIKGKEKDIVY